MKLTLTYGGPFYEKIKKHKETIEIDKSSLTVQELVDILFQRYPQLAEFFEDNPNKIFEFSTIIVRGRVLIPKDLPRVQLEDGEEVFFLPVVHGGAL
ncbi:hypothetical protein EP1X_09130 [Thermococcus sp. EP1]|uniref:MoaD/ThiS family protein n=1 Tax=Thermococcus sp. EP1 TaxID=1591054 RepID=UPI0006DB1C77|nr:MoaD/ThiS family protein [Thermococcus sp. EP1]KPU62366.1 hypothetical protein EP1X_09130 [Thermococcus sp. EP1]